MDPLANITSDPTLQGETLLSLLGLYIPAPTMFMSPPIGQTMSDSDLILGNVFDSVFRSNRSGTGATPAQLPNSAPFIPGRFLDPATQRQQQGVTGNDYI